MPRLAPFRQWRLVTFNPRRGAIGAATAGILAVSAPALPAQGVDAPATTLVELTDPRLRVIRDTVVTWVRNGRIPSMAIAVSVDGRPIWSEGIGWADRERRVPTSVYRTYPLGSLSKSIAALGVMALVADGSVSLDAPLSTLLPMPLRSVGGDSKLATLRHLLNMSAGIPHGWLAYAQFRDAYPTSPLRDMALAAMTQVVFPPGTVHEYSNFSAGLTEHVVERVGGEPYAAFMRRRVFTPLGMDSAWTGVERESAKRLVSRYTARGTKDTVPEWFVPAGGGGFRASALDLLRYGEYLVGVSRVVGAPAPPALVDTMMQYAGGPGGLYALGWFRGTDRMVSNGSITGANANLTLAPSKNVVAVCLLNATSPSSDADRICGRIVDAIDPRPADVEARSMRRYMETWEPRYRATPLLDGRWTGVIHTAAGPIPTVLEFGPDSLVHISVGDGPRVAMRNPVFNQFRRFDAGFRAILPTFESAVDTSAVDAGLKLYVDGDAAVGYALPRFGTARGGFAIPLPARFTPVR